MSAIKGSRGLGVSAAGQAATRSGVLVSVTQALLAETGLGVAKFSEALAEKYFELVAEPLRRGPLRVPAAHGNADEYYKALQANTKAVQRYLDGTVPIPVDMEEAFVEVLPKPYRDRAVFELCARFGVLPVLISEETDIHALAELMRDDASMIEAMAPILSDGEIDERDIPAAVEAIPHIKRAMASQAGLLRRLEAIVGGESSLKVVGGNS